MIRGWVPKDRNLVMRTVREIKDAVYLIFQVKDPIPRLTVSFELSCFVIIRTEGCLSSTL